MTPSMDRRAVLALPVAAGAFVALAATRAATAGPDAALLALCAEFQRLNARLWALSSDGLSDEEMEQADEEIGQELERVGEALIALPPAVTTAGMWARVAAVLAWRPVLLEPAPCQCLDEQLVGMVLRELAAATGDARQMA